MKAQKNSTFTYAKEFENITRKDRESVLRKPLLYANGEGSNFFFLSLALI